MEKQCEAFNGLNPALLAAVCYPNAGYPQLRFCSDFLAYLFFLDNLSDDLDTRDTSSVANVILNCFYHPDTFESTSRIAEMSKKSVIGPKIWDATLNGISVYSGACAKLPQYLFNADLSRRSTYFSKASTYRLGTEWLMWFPR
jgi:hypothetical protein